MKLLYKILFTFLLVASTVGSTYAFNDGFIYDQKIRLIQAYPNPATTNINFESNNINEKGFVISIYNFIGKKVDEVKLNGSKVNIPLNNYYRGLYVYQLRDKQGQLIESGKFQVVK